MINFRKARFLVLAGLLALVVGVVATNSADAGNGGHYGGFSYATYHAPSYYAPVHACYKPYVYKHVYPHCYNTYFTPTYSAVPYMGGLYW